jgi:hypothetical protein
VSNVAKHGFSDVGRSALHRFLVGLALRQYWQILSQDAVGHQRWGLRLRCIVDSLEIFINSERIPGAWEIRGIKKHSNRNVPTRSKEKEILGEDTQTSRACFDNVGGDTPGKRLGKDAAVEAANSNNRDRYIRMRFKDGVNA